MFYGSNVEQYYAMLLLHSKIYPQKLAKWQLQLCLLTPESIFTARRSYSGAVLGVVILTVCPSVTRVLCD